MSPLWFTGIRAAGRAATEKGFGSNLWPGTTLWCTAGDAQGTNGPFWKQSEQLVVAIDCFRTAPAGEGFGYNEIGNITSKNGVPLVYGDAAHKHAVTSYNGTTYVYDANGCMVSRGTQTIKYDPESRPVRVDAGGTVYRLAYDGDGVRRKRLDAGGTIHYVGGYERNVGTGQDTTQTVTKFYYATLGTASRLIGLRRQGTFYYVCTDRLGSTVKVVNEQGSPQVASLKYEAFGADRGSTESLVVDKRYTGQTADQSIGLYFYQSRYYDPELGRFVSPDTIVPDYKNPQALNRYAYGYNNPLKYIDPSGYDPLGSEWEAEWAANHPGEILTDEDRRARLFSVIFRGSEPNGSWNDDDWAGYYAKTNQYWRGTAGPSIPSGVDSFTTNLNRLAAWYSQGEEAAFVQAIGLVWGGIPSGPTGAWDARNGPVYTPLQEGHGNWKPAGIDAPDEGNQVHHYAGMLYTGFVFGEIAGYAINLARDLGNGPDLALGNAAVRHGAMLRQGVIRMDELALAFKYLVDDRAGLWPSNTPGNRSPRRPF